MKNIEIELDDCHIKILDSLQPFYGKDRSEVINNIVIRWIEQNIQLAENIKKLTKI